MDGWDYKLHPGDCHPRVESGVWTVCCRECAGTGVFPVPWIRTAREGWFLEDATCVSCKATGRVLVVLAATANSCHYCNREPDTRDHIVPRIYMGAWYVEVQTSDLPAPNLVPCCQACNNRKSHFRSTCECRTCLTAWLHYGPAGWEKRVRVIDPAVGKGGGSRRQQAGLTHRPFAELLRDYIGTE